LAWATKAFSLKKTDDEGVGMLRLFQSIFGRNDAPGSYPKALIGEAIERAVDGTDPWLRGVTGYRRKLRPVVVTAIDHVISMVEGFHAPIELSQDSYARNPLLRACFVSSQQIQDLLNQDPALNAFRNQQCESRPACVYALMMMHKDERQAFGAELMGDMLVRDVPQITVSFSHHRFIDLSADIEETKRLLKRRAYDHLLTLALNKIVVMRDERERLGRNRDLLQAKLNLFRLGRWGFDALDKTSAPTTEELEAEMAVIENQLLDLDGADQPIESHLKVVQDVLGSPQDYLWTRKVRLAIDPMGIKRNQPSNQAPELWVDQIQNSAGRDVIVSLVCFRTATA
jgi:hypothetical protein